MGSAVTLNIADGQVCCAFFDSKRNCHDKCQGVSCNSRCESRCYYGQLCGSWPCQEVNSEGCTNTVARLTNTCTCMSTGGCVDSFGATCSSCCPGQTCTPAGCA